MRRFILIIIHTFLSLAQYLLKGQAQIVLLVLLIMPLKKVIQKAWREIHANRRLFIQSNQLFEYNYSLSDIYKGTYQYLDDDTLKNENIEALEYVANEFFNGKQEEIEEKYGSMWEKLYWLSRIYHCTNNIFFDISQKSVVMFTKIADTRMISIICH